MPEPTAPPAWTPPIGILGGMFDPVHFGHLRSAVELRDSLRLREVRLIPCARPPHRSPALVSAEQRCAMLRLAISGEPGLQLDDREMRRETPSYSVDTLVSLRAEFTFSPLCFVVGMDAFLGLPTWHRWRDLFELAHLVVLTRPGREPLISQDLRSEMERRHTEDVTDLHTALHGRIMFLRVTQLEISSTAIREALGKGRSVRFLLPDGVYDYIRQCDLYRLTPSLMA